MKAAFLAVLLFLGINSQSQQIKPFKGATTIVAATDTASVLDKLQLLLIENDFTIDQKGTTYIITTGKALGIHSAKFRIRAVVKDSALHFTGATAIVGNILSGSIDESYMNLKYSGMKGSIMRDAWAELEKIAKQFNKELKYQ